MRFTNLRGIIQKKIDKNISLLLVFCFIFYTLLSWILLFRDGQGLYGIIAFYNDLFPFVLAIEPYLVRFGINSIPTLLFIGVTFISFYCYYRGLFIKISLQKTIIYAVVFQAIIFFSYPALSTDIFSYIFSDRIATVYNQNVWTTKPITYDSDKFSRLADWKTHTRVYGGVNQFIYNNASRIGGNNLFLNVFLYKLVAWIFTLLTMYMIYVIAKELHTGKESIILRIIFWNPLFILEILGSAHNDIIMTCFTLLAYYFFLRKNWLVAGGFLALAVQIKIIPIFLCIFWCLQLLLSRKVRALSLFLVSFIFINTLTFFYMGIDPFSFAKRISENTAIYWQSLPTVIHQFYAGEGVIFTTIFAGILLWLVIYQIWKKKDGIDMYAYCLFFYLIFITSAYWNWYVLWVLTLTPFITSQRLVKAILLLSFTSALAYPLYWLSLRFGYQHIFWIFVMPMCILLVPAVGFLLFTNKKLIGSNAHLPSH